MKEKYLTVTALTKYIKRKLETDPHLQTVWLKGEISNFKHHSSGHMYFTLKDEHSRIQSVMFAGNNRFLKFRPENGMHVFIKGYVSVFEPYGQYQLYVQQMNPDGLGALYLAYEQLKEKLEKQGYFAKEHKQPLPKFPNHIGIITSRTGAAVRDILITIKRRYPIVKTTIIPAIVQGDQAASSIYQAIEKANKLNMFDVLILARGGGSIEDLWPFNEEIVAKAIFNSSIPIVSAIGHETDVTISDFVADLRAPTPTAAAEIVVPSIEELRERIYRLNRSLDQLIHYHIEAKEKSLQRLKGSYAFKYPRQLIEQKAQQHDLLNERLIQVQRRLVEGKQQHVQQLTDRLTMFNIKQQIEQQKSYLLQLTKRHDQSMRNIFKQKHHQFIHTVEKLSLMNPLAVMKRGFAIVYDEERDIVKSTTQVKSSDRINVHISDGKLHCEVIHVEEEDD